MQISTESVHLFCREITSSQSRKYLTRKSNSIRILIVFFLFFGYSLYKIRRYSKCKMQTAVTEMDRKFPSNDWFFVENALASLNRCTKIYLFNIEDANKLQIN